MIYFGSRQGLTSASRQMTIFYGGQAHVFDDVHPNKVCCTLSLHTLHGHTKNTNQKAYVACSRNPLAFIAFVTETFLDKSTWLMSLV